MNTRIRLIVILLGGLLVVAIYSFPLWQPLTVNEEVNEVFPGIAPDLQEAFLALPPDQQDAYRQMLDTDPEMTIRMVEAVLRGDNVVSEEEQAMPDMTDPSIISTGAFVQINVIHGAEGTVAIYQIPDAGRILRFEDFHSTNGPDLRVLLATSEAPRNADELGTDFVELGTLKGNVGNQNYEIPVDVDLSLYQSVVIYSLTYQIVFSTATLIAA